MHMWMICMRDKWLFAKRHLLAHYGWSLVPILRFHDSTNINMRRRRLFIFAYKDGCKYWSTWCLRRARVAELSFNDLFSSNLVELLHKRPCICGYIVSWVTWTRILTLDSSCIRNWSKSSPEDHFDTLPIRIQPYGSLPIPFAYSGPPLLSCSCHRHMWSFDAQWTMSSGRISWNRRKLISQGDYCIRDFIWSTKPITRIDSMLQLNGLDKLDVVLNLDFKWPMCSQFMTV